LRFPHADVPLTAHQVSNAALVLQTRSLAEEISGADGGAGPIGGAAAFTGAPAAAAGAGGSASAAKAATQVLGHYHLLRVVVHKQPKLHWSSCGTLQLVVVMST
jgi:hypothetical protein